VDVKWNLRIMGFDFKRVGRHGEGKEELFYSVHLKYLENTLY